MIAGSSSFSYSSSSSSSSSSASDFFSDSSCPAYETFELCQRAFADEELRTIFTRPELVGWALRHGLYPSNAGELDEYPPYPLPYPQLIARYLSSPLGRVSWAEREFFYTSLPRSSYLRYVQTLQTELPPLVTIFEQWPGPGLYGRTPHDMRYVSPLVLTEAEARNMLYELLRNLGDVVAKAGGAYGDLPKGALRSIAKRVLAVLAGSRQRYETLSSMCTLLLRHEEAIIPVIASLQGSESRTSTTSRSTLTSSTVTSLPGSLITIPGDVVTLWRAAPPASFNVDLLFDVAAPPQPLARVDGPATGRAYMQTLTCAAQSFLGNFSFLSRSAPASCNTSREHAEEKKSALASSSSSSSSMSIDCLLDLRHKYSSSMARTGIRTGCTVQYQRVPHVGATCHLLQCPHDLHDLGGGPQHHHAHR